MSEERCPCGARIVRLTHIDMDDGLETSIYTCGVCGTQLEIIEDADPQRF